MAEQGGEMVFVPGDNRSVIDAPKRFWDRGRVDGVSLDGSSGSILNVRLKNENLASYNPRGVSFRGVKLISHGEVVDEFSTTLPSPSYSSNTREIRLIVEKDRKAKGTIVTQEKYSGLSIIHEIGHARYDFDHPEVYNDMLVAKTVLNAMRLARIRFDKSVNGKVDVRDSEKFYGFVVDNLNVFSDGCIESAWLENVLTARGVDKDEFSQRVLGEISKLYGEFMSEEPVTDKEFLDQMFGKYYESYVEIQKTAESQSENGAWDKARPIIDELEAKGIKVWDKSRESLGEQIRIAISTHQRLEYDIVSRK